MKFIIFNLLLILGAFNYNFIIRPLNVMAGGINGLSVIIENLFNINPPVFIFIFQISIFLISLLILGVKMSINALYSTIMYPLYIYLISFIRIDFNIINNYKYFFLILGGIITGVVSGYICKIGKSPGGIILISQIINKLFKYKISLTNFLINLAIILFGIISSKFTFLVESFVFLVINKLCLDYILKKYVKLSL